jgi:hypothetical protein
VRSETGAMVLAIMFIPRSRIPWEESFSEQIFPFNGLQVRELFRVRENHLNSIEFFLLIAQRARQVCSIANTPWSLANSSAQGDVCAPAYLSTARDTTKIRCASAIFAHRDQHATNQLC